MQHPRAIHLPVAEPQLLEDATKATILIRYVHLNPARARIVSDPLAWRWSTLRKVALQIPGWIDFAAVAALHGARSDTLAAKLLHFTLNDPFCGVEAEVLRLLPVFLANTRLLRGSEAESS